jgi:hypothetical protein
MKYRLILSWQSPLRSFSNQARVVLCYINYNILPFNGLLYTFKFSILLGILVSRKLTRKIIIN